MSSVEAAMTTRLIFANLAGFFCPSGVLHALIEGLSFCDVCKTESDIL